MVTKRKSFLAGFAIIAFIIALVPSHTVSADTYPLPANGKCNNNDTQINQNGVAQCQPATTNQTSPPAAANATNSGNDNDTTCAIEKIGWILCPVIETSGKIGDQAFNMLARFFLQTEPELVADNSGTKIAWELARNLANIMFIIAFLVIIISQVTSMGINNYGIKKMLPRLVVAAIAVNVSYYICQLAVDLSNITGWEIKDFLVQTAQQVSPDRAAMPVPTGIDTQTSDGTLAALAIGILALGAVFLLLPVLFSVIMMVAITCMVITIILLLRKAIIVLLVVVSPIAFVLYLLPNTERLFNRWLKMFGQLLMVFPVVALLFGGGQLASNIVLVAGSQQGSQAYSDSSQKCIQLPSNTGGSAQVGNCRTSGSATPVLLGLVAAGIAVAPLIAVWSVLKGALAAAGAIGGKIQSGVSRAGGSLSKGARSADQWKNKRVGENMQGRWQNMQSRGLRGSRGRLDRIAGGYAQRKAMRNKKLELAKDDLEGSKAQAITDILGSEKTAGALTSNLSGEGAARAVRGAQAAQNRQQIEEMQAAAVKASQQSGAELDATISRFDAGEIDVNSPELAAAIDELGKRQNFAQLEHLMNTIAGRGGSSLANRTLAQTVAQNTGGMFSGGQVAQISRGELSSNYMQTLNQNIKDGIAPEKLGSFNGALTDEVSRAIRTGAASSDTNLRQLSQEAAVSMSQSAGKLVADEILSKKVSGTVLAKMENFENGRF